MSRSPHSLVDSVSLQVPPGHLPTGVPDLCLEICRGRTRHPQRPISTDGYLIGAGDVCDLRLGGDGIPAQHSMIHVDSGEYWLDALATGPEVKVNGQPTNRTVIHEGDRIQIGVFEFVVRQLTQAEQAVESSDDASGMADHDEAEAFDSLLEFDDDRDVRELSAAELVELIELEQLMVDEFEENRNRGAEALMRAIFGRKSSLEEMASPQPSSIEHEPIIADSATSPRSQQPDEAESLTDLEHVLQELNVFSQHLSDQSRRNSHREASYADAAAQLLEIQQRLTAQMEVLSQQIATLRESDSVSTRTYRASA